MSKRPNLDQFYTKPSIVEQILEAVDCTSYDLVLEPSAGAGDFYERLPHDTRVGIDLAPAHPDVQRANFLDYVPNITENVLTIGNPPFGKNSSLAVKFFNHAAQFSDCIAFILPRTFRKPSIINRLDPNFQLVRQQMLPLDSFYVPSGETYRVPTVFQVWQKTENKREPIKTLKTHPDFSFIKIESSGLKPSDSEKKQQHSRSDFCVRRVGVKAGTLYKDFSVKSRDWKSHYYIKQNIPQAESIMRSIQWDYDESPKFDTAGNPSISKHDLIKFYKEAKRNYEQRNTKSNV